MRALMTFAVTAALLLAACAQGPAKLTVTMDEWSIKLSQSSVPSGSVAFSLQNAGKEEHELVILKTDIAPDKLALRASDPTKVEEPGAVGEIEEVAPGTSKEATFDLQPGNYVLICNEATHYQAGMRIAFVVR